MHGPLSAKLITDAFRASNIILAIEERCIDTECQMCKVFQALIYAIGTFQNVRRKSELSTYMVNYETIYVHVSPVKIRTVTRWNLIGRSATTPSPVIAHQYSSATFVSLCFYAPSPPKKKNRRSFRKWCYLNFFHFFFISHVGESSFLNTSGRAKLRKSP